MTSDGGCLVVTPGWVGDVVMCQSLFATLRRRAPDTRLDALAPPWARGLIERMPEVDEVIDLPVGHGRLRPGVQMAVARTVRARRYHQAIVTRRSLKSALVPFLAGVPRRTGVLGESRHFVVNDVRAIDGGSHPSAAVRLAALGMESGTHVELDDVPWPALTVDEGRGAALETSLALEGEGLVVGFAPGAAFGPAKRWPLERWGRLAGRLAQRGYRVWVFGSESEAAEGAAIEAEGGHAGGVANLCGRTSLADAVDLMGRCDVVVSNDSGLMHVAAASGARVVALFGSTSPINTPPLARDATVIWRQLDCSPCYERECPLGHLRCLREITVDEVVAAVEAAPPSSVP